MIRNEWKTSKDTQKLPQESKPTHHSREQERRLAIFRTGNNKTKQKKLFCSETAKKAAAMPVPHIN